MFSLRPFPLGAYTLVIFGQRFFFVEFNEPLVPGTGLDIGNWSWTWGNYRWAATAVAAGANLIRLRPIRGNPTADPDRISFDPPPHDVLALSDNSPAASFSDFPIT